MGGRVTITYNSPLRRTFGVCLVAAEKIDRIIGRLERVQSFASNPLLSLVILVSTTVQNIRLEGMEVIDECESLAIETGYDYEDHETDFDQMANYAQMPQRLNVLSSRLATLEYGSSCLIKTLDRLEEQLKSLPSGYCKSVSLELQEQILYFRECSTSNSLITKRCNQIIQSMLQTVRNSLTISAKGLRLWSQVYANLQQRDNQLNHRYGADMRLITAITLIFLPGTFVATFFSTTFWDFSPDNDGVKVTYWVYLYFVVTIGLTMLVLIVWRRFSTMKRLTMNMVQLARQIPVLGRLIRKKKVNDEESGKKGD